MEEKAKPVENKENQKDKTEGSGLFLILFLPVLLPLAYVVLGAPMGGLLCFVVRHVHLNFRSEAIQAWIFYVKLYEPLFSLAGRLGCVDQLMAFWNFFGWESFYVF